MSTSTIFGRVVNLEKELRAITRKTKQGEKAVDRLIQVWLKEGGEQWVLVHVEIQSQKEEGFAFRLFRYFFRGLDYFDGRPLTCLVVLGDPNLSWRPTGYQQEWWGTSVDFRYRTVKLSDFSQRPVELERSSNPFARFVLAHLKTLETQGQYETRMEWKLRIIQGLYAMGYSEAEIGSLYHDFD